MTTIESDSGSKRAKKDAGVEMIRTGKSWAERLDVPMTQEQKAEMGPRIHYARQEVKALEDAIGALKATYKARIELAEGVVEQLCIQADRGTREQDVMVKEIFVDRTATVEIWREDTGEKIRERPMTAAELNPTLPGIDETKPEPAFGGFPAPVAASVAGPAHIDLTTDPDEDGVVDDDESGEGDITDPDALLASTTVDDSESQVPPRKRGRPAGSKNKTKN